MEVEASSELGVVGDRPLGILNASDGVVSTGDFANDPQVRQLAASLSRWVDRARAATGRTSMFDRGAYTPPDNPYDEMRSARHALRYDSIVSGVAEITEAFAFQGVKWECENSDEADVFNQMAIDMNLDAVIRKMWREEYTYGQFVAAKLWDYREFTVRGKTKDGNQRKKKYKVWCPVQIRILDSCKVVPIGVGPLGGEGLAWQASIGEIGDYTAAYQGETIDPLMTTFFQGEYKPDYFEAGELGRLGVNTSRLLIMNPQWVFRHTITKPDYERFADIRMKSVFELLDLKKQLMQADRAALIGSANYILLIRKGNDATPALPEEMSHLKENYNFIAKMPVIISDHRLEIDIIAPIQDMVLNSEKYEVLDTRILGRLLGLLTSGNSNSGRTDDQESLALTVSRVMENRRHMIKRSLEIEIARAVVNHPKNKGIFDTEPNLVYTPRNITMGKDSGYTQALLTLRTQREISRETILEFFGLDEAVEALRMQIEAEMYDDIFKTEIPYSKGQPTEGVDPALDKKDSDALAITVSPDGTLVAAPAKPAAKKPAAKTTTAPKATAPKVAPKTGPNGTKPAPQVTGGRGGRPAGGGTTPKSPTATAKPRTRGGNVSTKG